MRHNENSRSNESLLSPIGYLVLSVAFVTLFVQTTAFDPFNSPKFSALIVIASLIIMKLVTLTDLKLLKRIKLNVLFLALLVFFTLSGVISVIFADNLFIALLGDTQRRNGYLAYLALSIICLAAYEFINFRNALIMIKFIIITGFIFSLYCLIQLLGKDFIAWSNLGNPVIGTAGNPNFASALMAIFGIASITSLFLFGKFKVTQFIAMLCLIMSVIGIYSSDSRQGIVALLLGVLFFTTFFLSVNHKRLGLIVGSFSLAVSLLSVAGMLQKGPLAPFLYKPSLSVRGYYWEAAFEMLRNHFFTGVGFDHYGYYFKEVRDPGYALEFGYTLSSTNAHNTFLQMFATGGVFLGFSYLILVIATLLIGLRLVKNTHSQNRVIALSILTIWVVFQAQSVISIDNLAISVWGWLLTGAIFGLYYENSFLKGKIQPQSQTIKRKKTISPLYIPVFIFLFIPAIFLSVSIVRIESSLSKISGNFTSYLNQMDKNSDLSRRLLGLIEKDSKNVQTSSLIDPNYKLQLAYIRFDLGDKVSAIRDIEEVVNEFPRNIYGVKALGQLLATDRINEAIQYRKRLTLLDPWNAENYLQLLYLYKASGDLVKAQVMRDIIISFAPGTNEAKVAMEELLK